MIRSNTHLLGKPKCEVLQRFVASMNLSLIDPFILAQDYPDALTGKVRMLLTLP